MFFFFFLFFRVQLNRIIVNNHPKVLMEKIPKEKRQQQLQRVDYHQRNLVIKHVLQRMHWNDAKLNQWPSLYEQISNIFHPPMISVQ